MCFECKQNPDRPHICVMAQQFGDCAKCCGSDSKICYSFREAAKQLKLQFGDKSPANHIQAIINSQHVRLD